MSDAPTSPNVDPAPADSLLAPVRLADPSPHVVLAAPVIAIRCHYCSRFVRPGEYMPIGESVVMCWNCEEKHRGLIAGFAPPRECQECHTPTELIAARAQGAKWSMFLHFKDGVYQMLCKECSDLYIGKRKDLYGRTQFGWDIKLS